MVERLALRFCTTRPMTEMLVGAGLAYTPVAEVIFGMPATRSPNSRRRAVAGDAG